MSKQFKKKKGAELEEIAAEALVFGYYLLVIVGEGFSSSSAYKMVDAIANEEFPKDFFFQTNTIRTFHEEFYGGWGRILNRCLNSRPSSTMETILHWKETIFKEGDVRFLKKEAKKKNDATSHPLNMPSRFFLMTGNFDNELLKTGFVEKEIYEMNGNISQWQCIVPCKKDAYWKIDPNFRFEVDSTTGKAPTIKYVSEVKKTKHVSEILAESNHNTSNQTSPTSTPRNTDLIFSSSRGDPSMYNFKHPLGWKPIPTKPIQTTNSAILSQRALIDKNSMFRFYAPSSAKQQVNTEVRKFSAQRPKSAAKYKTLFDEIHAEKNTSVRFTSEKEEKEDYLSYDDSEEDEVIDLTDFKEESFHQSKFLKPKLQTENNKSLQTTKNRPHSAKSVLGTKSRPISGKKQLSIRHDEYHKQIVNEIEEITTMEMICIDPMVYHMSYYTHIPLQLEDNITTMEGSNCNFIISMQLQSVQDAAMKSKIHLGVERPFIKKRSLIDGKYVDLIIIEAEKYISPSEQYIPLEAIVSVIVDPMTTDSVEERFVWLQTTTASSWQICGKYNLSSLKEDDKEQDFSTDLTLFSERIIDLKLVSRDSYHSIALRVIQEDPITFKLVNIFVELPVSNYNPNPVNNIIVNKKSVNQSAVPTLLLPEVYKPSYEMASELITPPTTFVTREQAVKSFPKPTISRDNSKTLKTPVVNRVLCNLCHGLARPRVKMGSKDKNWIPFSASKFKNWSNDVIMCVKQNPEKALVVLELGCELKMRKQTDQILKQIGGEGTILIRINPIKLTAKEPTEGDNLILIMQDSVASAMDKIDSFLYKVAKASGISL